MNKTLIFSFVVAISFNASAERNRYYLESFDLCSFKSIFISNDFTSISVLTPEPIGIVDAVKGSYIGKNDGKIESIEINKIVLSETVLTSDGKWVKKKAQITINEAGDITSCLSNGRRKRSGAH